MTGAIFNHLRDNVGSPTRLTEAEWLDRDLAQNSLIGELVAQAYVQCASVDSAAIEECQFRVLSKSVKIDQEDLDYCMARGHYAVSCFVDKGFAKFIRESSALLWD